jgi:hypothetical protein
MDERVRGGEAGVEGFLMDEPMDGPFGLSNLGRLQAELTGSR